MRADSFQVTLLLLMAGCLLGNRPDLVSRPIPSTSLTSPALACWPMSGPLARHDFHASVTQMQYNAKERVFEISVRIFTDDLEKALSHESGHKVNLDAADKNDPIIEKYIRSHIAYVNPQKQASPIRYVGHEVEADAHWLYLEMPYAEPFRGGLLKQDALMELFDDQVNMVNIQYQGQKKTFVFRKNQVVQNVSLN